MKNTFEKNKMFGEFSKSRGAFFVNILNSLLFSQYKLRHRSLTGLYIGLQKYWDFQSETKVEQIIVIVTTHSVSCYFSHYLIFYCSMINYKVFFSQFCNWNFLLSIIFKHFVTFNLVLCKRQYQTLEYGNLQRQGHLLVKLLREDRLFLTTGTYLIELGRMESCVTWGRLGR